MQVVSRALTDDGYGIGTPFKSSRIGKDVGYKALQKYYGMSKDKLKKPGALDRLRQTVKHTGRVPTIAQSGKYQHCFPDQPRRKGLRRNVYRPHQWHCRQRFGAGKGVLGRCFQRAVPDLPKRNTAYRRTARGTPIRTTKPHGKSCLRSCRHVVGLGRCAGFRGTAKNPATAEKKETASIITKIEF